MCPVGDLTADGYDLQFGQSTRATPCTSWPPRLTRPLTALAPPAGTNVIGHYLLTKRLVSIPRLLKAGTDNVGHASLTLPSP